MRKKSKYDIIKNYNFKQIAILFILVIFAISFVSVLARYVVKKISNFYTYSQEFYFDSDKLKEDNPVYQLENWPGVDPYTITINMNSYGNNLLKTSYDIEYEISYVCSNNAICQISKQDNKGVISANTNTDFFNVIITPNTALKPGDIVSTTITATTKEPYKKTLEARFYLIVGEDDFSYEITDHEGSQYLEISITNTLSYYKVKDAFDNYNVDDRINVDTYLSLSDANKQKCYSTIVNIAFNTDNVLLDMTNSNYLNADNITNLVKNNYNYITGIEFRMEPLSSAVVRFYKVDVTKDYSYPNTSGQAPIVTVTN